ncbi:hypothetical protein GCM10023091_07890 [Ravibacter arvi]|uniref:Uncharacterized protein n=1 Tax=Ravibacter arvi TaxID=2051041 RepID=A0ABP8LSR3_9BACT
MRRKTPLHVQVSMIVSCFMALVYVGGGLFLMASSSSFGFLKAGTWERILLGVLLVGYGCFRAQRAWKIYKDISES